MQRQARWFAVATTISSVLLGSTAAHAVEIQAGDDWKIKATGFAAGFLQFNLCDHSAATVDGGFACNTGPGGNNRSAISNGLGVGSLGLTASTQKSDWDLGVTSEVWSGINSTSKGGKIGFGETSPSMRQSFVFFGRKDLGTFKVGRMFGVFGSEGIASDMTLAGVGSGAAGVSGAGNSTLGRIGVGYIFADFFPQIQYNSPDLHGFQVVASIIQAFDAAPMAGVNPVSLIEHPLPGLMGKATFDWKGDFAGRAWVGGWGQSSTSTNGQFTSEQSVFSSAFDFGTRLEFAGASLTGYGFLGDGVGTTAPMRDGVALVNGLPAKRKSVGYYGQLSYTIKDLKFGTSYGATYLDLASGEQAAGTLYRSNSSVIGGVYYKLGGVVTIAGEWTHTMSKNQLDEKIRDNSFALGTSAGF